MRRRLLDIRGELPPGTMRLVRGTPNPHGVEGAELFLLVGDPTAAPVQAIIPARGVTPPPPPDLSGGAFRLCILHFNDLHGQFSRSTRYGDRPVFSRMVWRVRELRRRSRDNPHLGVLFFSGGDDIVGSIYGELLGADPDAYSVHAGYSLYSAAGVDAGLVGNHELDMGDRVLARAIERDARFPLLSANVCASPLLDGLVYPAALLVVKGVRVGIVGVTTRGEVKCGDDLAHPLTVVQNLLPALRPMCDVLILLSHLGRSLSSTTATTCDVGDVELASSLPSGSVHVIVGGHTHDILNQAGLSVANLVNDIPIVQAGVAGHYLGEVDVVVGQHVSVASVRLTPTADLQVDEGFEREQVGPLLERVKPIVNQPLGPIVDLPDVTTESVRQDYASGESALANFICDALVDRCRAAGYRVDLAAVDASSIHCGLPAGGQLIFGDWFDVMPYADTIRIYRLTGQQLAAFMDDNARRVDWPGEPHVERGFLQFSRQMRYTVERGEHRRAARAVDVTVDGLSLDQQLGRVFLVACTSFLREAAAPWERHARDQLGLAVLRMMGALHADTELVVRNELVAHIRSHGGVTQRGGARAGRPVGAV